MTKIVYKTKVIVFDEFNQANILNFTLKLDKDNYFKIVCTKNLVILFPNFNEILGVEIDKYNKLYDTNEFRQYDKKKQEKLLQLYNNIEGEPLRYGHGAEAPEGHGYKFMFSNLSKLIQEGNYPYYKPIHSDYVNVRKKLKHIEKKIVCINGRNSQRHNDPARGRNNDLKSLILYLIKNNIFVINTTLPSYNLNIQHENYVDVSNDCLDYSKNVSYFLNSNAVVSVANSGGITTHICTGANFILYNSTDDNKYVIGDSWVDNPEFGYNNKSIYHAIKEKYSNVFKCAQHDNILKLVNSLEKPIVKSFFDESKIKSKKQINFSALLDIKS